MTPRRPHRRLVGRRRPALEGQVLPVPGAASGSRPRGSVVDRVGHRPVLGGAGRRLHAQPDRRPGRPGAGPGRLGDAAQAGAVPAARSRSRSCPSATSPSPTPPCRRRSGAPTWPSPTRTSAGMRHLRALADAGLTHVHLLPAFDFATIAGAAGRPGRARLRPGRRCRRTPSSSRRASAAVADTDGYNWGYDPLHYTVPEGCYADRPGRRRADQRVPADGGRAQRRRPAGRAWTWSTTTPRAAGTDPHSVLDQIVPGYYQRLLDDGTVANSTCCANTAPEHAMMGKLVVDSRGHLGQAVQGGRLPVRPDGPPPEGEHPGRAGGPGRAHPRPGTASTARRSCSTARAGTSARWPTTPGSSRPPRRTWPAPASAPSTTGCATRCAAAARSTTTRACRASPPGLFTDPNGDPVNGTAAEQRARLLHQQDLIKVGLTGNLRRLPVHRLRRRTASPAPQVDYNGSPAGYTAAPGEAVTYVDAHDNEILYDALAYKLPAGTSAADRARMQVLALATAVLGQGTGFVTGRLGPAALQVAGPQLVQLRRLVQRDPLGLRGGQRLRRRAAAGGGQRRPSGRTRKPLLADPALVPDCAAIDLADRRATGAAADPRVVAGVRPGHRRRRCSSGVSFPLSGHGRDPGRDHDDAGRPGLDRRWRSRSRWSSTPRRRRRPRRVPGLRGRDVALHPVLARLGRPGAAAAPRSTGRPARSPCRPAPWRCSCPEPSGDRAGGGGGRPSSGLGRRGRPFCSGLGQAGAAVLLGARAGGGRPRAGRRARSPPRPRRAAGRPRGSPRRPR